MQRTFGSLIVEVTRGDITAQPDMDAVVNAANAALQPGGGVAGAIHRVAGPALYQECVALAPIAPGEAVLSGAHGLPNRAVIHCLGPVYGQDEPAAALLTSCHHRALALADRAGFASVAFPALSTGIFGYPVAEAAPVALAAVVGDAATLQSVRHVRFVLFSGGDLQVFEAALSRLEVPT